MGDSFQFDSHLERLLATVVNNGVFIDRPAGSGHNAHLSKGSGG